MTKEQALSELAYCRKHALRCVKKVARMEATAKTHKEGSDLYRHYMTAADGAYAQMLYWRMNGKRANLRLALNR